MGNLGTMEPEKLLQLFSGSIGCAFVILLFIVGYVIISRRGSSGQMRRGTGKGGSNWGTSAYSSMPARTESLDSQTSQLRSETPGLPGIEGEEPVDVSARLAGTGREAWLEEVSDPLTLPKAPPNHGREVLRLMREAATGEVWIQVAGMRYRSLKEIRDRAVGERVLAAITHALRFSSGRVASNQGIIGLTLPACDAVKVPVPFGALSEMPQPDELIRLMSDPDQDHFCIHVAERCYKRLVDVEDQVIGRYILEALTRLLQFSNGMLATNNGVGLVLPPPLEPDIHTPLPNSAQPGNRTPLSTSTPPQGQEESPLSPSPSSSTETLLSEQERFLQQLMNQVPPVSPTIERPSLMGSIRRLRSKPSNDLLPSLNLAEEIDRIFQDKLMASTMRETDAKIEENPYGGVRIRIGRAFYNSPDEVPDSQLRSLLKLSIAEWERS